MKAMLPKYWLLSALIVFSATASLAQTDLQIEKLRVELERTDEVIDRAKEAVRAANVPVAVVALKQAIELQHGARERYQHRQFLMAYELTLKARELAKNALVRSRLTEQGETVVLRTLEQATELLERAKESMTHGPDGRLWTLYESAKDNLNRAWEFYRAQRYRPALKLANQVKEAARKILEASNREMRMYAEFERRFEAVGEVIERARDNVAECGNEASQSLLEQAVNAYQRSRELASQHQFDAALRNLQKAHRMAIEASKGCNGVGALDRRYERLKNEAGRVSEMIPLDNDAARKLLNQVYDQFELAEDFISRNQTEAATAALKAAQLTLHQV
jgi:hypothetical protein